MDDVARRSPGIVDLQVDGRRIATPRGTREAVEPQGEARPDWAILAGLANRILALQGRTPRGRSAGWSYSTPTQILDEVARAWVTDRVPEGVVFGNFHFPGAGNVNNLTILALDPVAKIPEYKVCAVRAEAIPAATVPAAASAR